eukprot:9275940-Pyramimonas_sp.AAC.1
MTRPIRMTKTLNQPVLLHLLRLRFAVLVVQLFLAHPGGLAGDALGERYVLAHLPEPLVHRWVHQPGHEHHGCRLLGPPL